MAEKSTSCLSSFVDWTLSEPFGTEIRKRRLARRARRPRRSRRKRRGSNPGFGQNPPSLAKEPKKKYFFEINEHQGNSRRVAKTDTGRKKTALERPQS